MKLFTVACGCGCGETIIYKHLPPSQLSWRGPIRYKRGHHNRGRKHTAEHIEMTRRPMELNGRWKGGRIFTADGYVNLKRPNHPNANKQGYIREHRAVMEEKLGRLLRKDELVHHINGIKDDNRPENIEVMQLGAHSVISNRGSHKPRANRAMFICQTCGKTFYRSHWWANQIVKFCSWSCRYPHRSRSQIIGDLLAVDSPGSHDGS